jgi:hypothetical protein
MTGKEVGKETPLWARKMSGRGFFGVHKYMEVYQLIDYDFMPSKVKRAQESAVFRRPVDRWPRLDTVMAIERALENDVAEHTLWQVWRELKPKVMWSTFLTTVDYLEHSGKILVHDKRAFWVWNPKEVARIKREGLLIR